MQTSLQQLHGQIKSGSFQALARGITIVENELSGYAELLKDLNDTGNTKVVGITGPPGAGKSTLVNALLGYWLAQGKKVAVLAVDPSSPFNYGSLLGDRIRMNEFYTNKNIYIRSLSARGALGGLNSKIVEITDLVKEAGFDIVLVETVGVGQSEVEVAGLADCTVVVLVPEAGDEVQTLKAGIMEIADIFVVNKADRADAEGLYRNLRMLVHEKATDAGETPVVKTIATGKDGVAELSAQIMAFLEGKAADKKRKTFMLTEKALQIIRKIRMKDIDTAALSTQIAAAIGSPGFNLYRLTEEFLANLPSSG